MRAVIFILAVVVSAGLAILGQGSATKSAMAWIKLNGANPLSARWFWLSWPQLLGSVASALFAGWQMGAGA